ncbi:MAG: alpha/beta hydrolase [Lachnospiraceae bacterium]|nr:alpha/beta hydrolase [Lachnospiraceae bacterium]
MRYVMEVENKENALTTFDNIVFSHVTDLEGRPMDLKLSITAAMGNTEMRTAMGWYVGENDKDEKVKRPVIVWINGGGWRGVEKNNQLGELIWFARRGFAVACVYYRSSAEGHMPAQIEDCKTAVRFLRAHAEKYSLDPDRFIVMGRSAGGHLTLSLSLNDDRFVTDEWADYSSNVQVGINMFGAGDIWTMTKEHLEEEAAGKKLSNRWDTIWETHEGAALGGPREDLLDRALMYSPTRNITEQMAPLMTLHGDADPLVDLQFSIDLYDDLCRRGREDKTDLMIIPGAGHGSAEFFQEPVKEKILAFIEKWI